MNRNVLIFTKELNGRYVTIQAISDGRQLLQTDTMYIIQNEGPQDAGHDAANSNPVNNAQSVPPQGPSVSIIPQTSPEVNLQAAAPTGKISDLEVLRKLALEMARESIRRGDLGPDGPVPEISPRPVQQSPQEILSRLAWEMAMDPQTRAIPPRPVQPSAQEILSRLAREMTQDPGDSLAALSDEDLRAMLDEIARRQSGIDKTGNPIENSAQYDILEETGYSIQPITEESIQKVALVQPHGLSKIQAKQLQDAHKKLLHSVMEKPAGTEACVLYATDMGAEIDHRVGKEDGQSVSIPRCTAPHIAIHNHPDNNVFSLRDLVTFLQNDKMKGITAVCNSGKVFSLSKAEDYDGFLFWRELESVLPLLDDAVERQDIDEYVNIITKLLQRSGEYGVEFIEG